MKHVIFSLFIICISPALLAQEEVRITLKDVLEHHNLSPVQQAQITDALKAKKINPSPLKLAELKEIKKFRHYMIKKIPRTAIWSLMSMEAYPNYESFLRAFDNKQKV